MDERLSHADEGGRARMVDVSAKAETARRAVAEARVELSEDVLRRVLDGDLPKGAVVETARIAGVMGAKRTADLVPLCHPLRIVDVQVGIEPVDARTLCVTADVRAVDRTGVEMEALCAATIAALTLYDMVKAVDRGMVVRDVRLLRKEGGRSGTWIRGEG